MRKDWMGLFSPSFSDTLVKANKVPVRTLVCA